MREDWPAWAREEWRGMSPAQQDRARAVWKQLAEGFDGVLVGPGPLVRSIVDEGEMGHRSTLETISRLAQAGLLNVRQAAEGPVLWIPEPLMPTPPTPRRDPPNPRFAATRRNNGRKEPPLARP